MRLLGSFFFLICTIALAQDSRPQFELDFSRLAQPLTLLSIADRTSVDTAITLIKKGEHAAALARLAALKGSNPDNSSLRILAAYAQRQLGNLLGAFEDAEKAERSPNGDDFKCWFLAKVALLAGKTQACERELKHIEGDPKLKLEVDQMREALKKAPKG